MEVYAPARQDGTDASGGEITYREGERTPERQHSYLYASTAVGECWPGFWRHRVFRAKADEPAITGFDHRSPNTGGFRCLNIIEELPAWQTFGPNGEEIVTMIDRTRAFTVMDLDRMMAELRLEWTKGDMKALNAAEEAAALHGFGRGAKGAAASVYNAVFFAKVQHKGIEVGTGTSDAAYKLAQACLAVATRNLVDEWVYHTLMGPWRQVVGMEET